MQLTFVPVEEFYFALTLAVRTLEEIPTPGLAETVGAKLAATFGQASTVAAASQNTYTYVFKVTGVDNSPNPQLMLSISDWQGSLRISSDYGWMLDAERKPVRTDRFAERSQFANQVKESLHTLLGVAIA